MQYHKITTVWQRDPATKMRTLVRGAWAKPEFEALAGLDWVWTEKINGTNIRISWPDGKLRIDGRTDNAQIPAHLYAHLTELFSSPDTIPAGIREAGVVFGEGFGAKIQKGGDYVSGRDEACFALFDIWTGHRWLGDDELDPIADSGGLIRAPIIGRGPLLAAIDKTEFGIESRFGSAKAEGIVARPPIPLMNGRGERIITKIKTKDFK